MYSKNIVLWGELFSLRIFKSQKNYGYFNPKSELKTVCFFVKTCYLGSFVFFNIHVQLFYNPKLFFFSVKRFICF